MKSGPHFRFREFSARPISVLYTCVRTRVCYVLIRYDEWVGKERIVDMVERGDSSKPPPSQLKTSPGLVQKHKVKNSVFIFCPRPE